MPLASLGLMAACRTVRATGEPEVPAAAAYVPPPPFVFESFADLAPDLFSSVTWGVESGDALVERLHLARYDLVRSSWGGHGELPVIQVTTPRRGSSTTLLLDPADGTVRSVLVRDLPDTPPPVATVEEMVPYLAAYPGRLLVLARPGDEAAAPADGSEGEAAAPRADERLLFVQGLGVKIGLARRGDDRWELDHVEYFDPAWGPEQLAAFKYGGPLVEVGAIGALERRGP